MKVKHVTKVNKIPKMIKHVRPLKGRRVNVGPMQGEHAWLAGIHEYGCKITVTPKMRAYLHSQGLHLKETTKEIVIPERSFLRASFDKNGRKVKYKIKKLLPYVVDGKMSDQTYLEMAGEMLASMVKDYMRDLSEPANHPFTVEQKGSSNPLIDTGEMLESITYEVK